MTTKNGRICPCCGKKLILIPPDRMLLPSRTGFSVNGVVYYYAPAKRFSKITSKPKAKHRKYSNNSWYFDGNLNPNIVKFDRINLGWHVVPVKYAQKRIDKDGLSLFSDELIFYCRNCGKKLMLNANPIRWFELITQIMIVFTIVLLFVLTVTATNGTVPAKEVFWGGGFVLVAGLCINVFFTMFSLMIIKYYESNFVPTDEYDNLIYPDAHLSLLTTKKTNYFREGNIFMVELEENIFYIYLVHKTQSLNFHICGIEGEPERLLSLIREKQEREETVILPLTFEGKFVGNAEVLETYDPPKSFDKER